MMKRTKVSAAVSVACSIMAGQAIAQDSMEEVVVTGIRGSLTNAMDIKRETSGVVDAISAQDMGKFPDTNLAESLQRITGVSIDRVEGEGSQITVRGFGGQFNLVTLNGRQMPAANVENAGTNNFEARGNSRSFDFSVLASEGVSGLQVYKTGRASAPSGGIGATTNITTIRPLEAGMQLAVSGKLVDDQGSDSGDLTPELSGLGSWTNDDDTIGVSVFASYQKREGSSRIGAYDRHRWFVPYDPDDTGTFLDEQVNPPEAGALSSYPRSTRLGYETFTRERTNAMLTMQFAPSDRLGVTVDALYTVNDTELVSLQDQQWHAREFFYVEWDGNPVVATPNVLAETYFGIDPAAPYDEPGTDMLHDNRSTAQKDEMTALGVNFDYQLNDAWAVNVDLSSAKSESGPGYPDGMSEYRTPVAGAISSFRAMDLTGPMPRTIVAVSDGWGNQNGIYELEDVGSQQARRSASSQTHELDQIQLRGSWDNGGDLTVDFGVGHVASDMEQYYQAWGYELGGWGIAFTGDIEEWAPGQLTQMCVACKFRDFSIGDTSDLEQFAPPGSQLITLGEYSMKVNPRQYYYAMDGWDYSPLRDPFDANNPPEMNLEHNVITEDTTSVYVSGTVDAEMNGRPVSVVAGLRYETTDVTSTTVQRVPQAIIWRGDTVFSEPTFVSEDHSYHNLLPSLDVSVDLSDDFKARASFSKTIARPQYGAMFVVTSVQGGSAFFGQTPTASKGSAELDPLESDNFDLSLEWYYGDSSYASVGFFTKAVSNFVGTGTVYQNLFGLRNARIQYPGNRVDQAVQALEALGEDITEYSLFTMVSLIANPNDPVYPGGASAYDGSSDQQLYSIINLEVVPDETDPLYEFQTAQPLNNETANIHGWELAWQHMFDNGFGFMANATLVDGDIKFDNSAPPDADQFALEGLSDSANLIVFYENDVWGARAAYNWRDDYLFSTNIRDFIPGYYDAHGQLDLNVTWNVNDQLSLSLEGINVTEEGIEAYGRTRNARQWAKELDARWVLAAHYTF